MEVKAPFAIMILFDSVCSSELDSKQSLINLKYDSRHKEIPLEVLLLVLGFPLFHTPTTQIIMAQSLPIRYSFSLLTSYN